MSSAPRVSTAGAGGPARGTPAGPVPAAGAKAADELSAQGGHRRGGGPVRGLPAGRCLRLAPQLPTGSMSKGDTAGVGSCGWRPGY